MPNVNVPQNKYNSLWSKSKQEDFLRSWLGGAVAQSVERATLGEEVPGSIPALAARSLQVGSVSV